MDVTVGGKFAHVLRPAASYSWVYIKNIEPNIKNTFMGSLYNISTDNIIYSYSRL